MKRLIHFTLGALVLIVLSACSEAEESKTNIVGNPLHTLEEPYTIDDALENGDVIGGTSVQNIDRFYEFLTNIENGVADSIRITKFTEEGSPIYHRLVWNDRIDYTADYTQDPFTTDGPNSIQSTTCARLEKVDSSREEYILVGCEFEFIGDKFQFVVE
ncbi:MAG: DUF4362 domain-containing protein [Bacillus sp. (in: Bacteria)]|nr:DUF4362 domain-containing protein [Bacillus sp. (in: firmicutes)]